MNLAQAFRDSARRHGGKTAVFWGDESITYPRLQQQTDWLARTIREQFGVRPGDRVALCLKNCPQFIPALFAIWEAGAVVVSINNFLKPAEIIYILHDAGIDLLICDTTLTVYFGALTAARPGLRFWQVEHFPDSISEGAEPASSNRTEKDLAILIYTSRTTGKPKGAMLSHGNLLHNIESCRRVLELVGEDRVILLLPMFHSFMLTVGILLPLCVGGSIVLIKSVHPPKAVLQEIIKHQGTLLPAVPPFFRALAHSGCTVPLPLRLCISGAAPLPAEILKEFNTKFSIPLLEGYGLSEASPVVSFNPIQGPWKVGSIGLPIYDVEVSVQNDEGRLLGPGETGEICVRGGNVMLGYWNQPQETARALRGGWLLTGDVGHRDADGYYYITDRKKDMLLVNGINVYPREIEEVLYQFPGIKEAAVIGVPDARRGEQPLAYVSANDGVTLTEQAILQFVRERLADYKVPRRVMVVPALPRNATGKILKTTLRQMSSM